VLGNDLLTLNARRWQALRGNDIAMVLQDPRYALNPVKSVRRPAGRGANPASAPAARARWRAFTTSFAPSG
jgi:ABC-type dipeptide/oligopeptide/nickel transport system ATPase component